MHQNPLTITPSAKFPLAASGEHNATTRCQNSRERREASPNQRINVRWDNEDACAKRRSGIVLIVNSLGLKERSLPRSVILGATNQISVTANGGGTSGQKWVPACDGDTAGSSRWRRRKSRKSLSTVDFSLGISLLSEEETEQTCLLA